MFDWQWPFLSFKQVFDSKMSDKYNSIGSYFVYTARLELKVLAYG